ncbi:GerAB/ArcD/ProY family transporter [Vallitalea sp.]|uniref:GerAB/ArcD/ProY family transporter n=1 Tax=Vallitalea sp. TaxID=1882829 RepID=UPI0025D5A262|nr:endospore germination permease [Vallitalea sp.]MCT4686496.1 spore germination protein [Vallitalea sp.]
MNQTLSNKQIAFIIFPFIIGYGIISLPKNISKNLGTGGWILIIIGSTIILFSSFLFVYLAKKFSNKTIYEYSIILTGKVITNIIITIICIYSISLGCVITRLASETIKLSFLLNTPVWALSLLMVTITFYALINNIIVISKLCEILSIVIIVFSLILILATFSQGSLTNLQPFFHFKAKDIVKTLPDIVFPFVGIEILAVIPMDIGKKNKGIIKYLVITIAIITFIYISAVETSIAVMGVDSVIRYEDAIFATIRRIEIDFLQSLKRLDFFFIIAWILTSYSSIVLSLYMGIHLLSKVFVKINRNIIVFIVCLTTYIFSLIPFTMDLLRKSHNYLGFLGLFILLIIPLFLITISLVKKHKM